MLDVEGELPYNVWYQCKRCTNIFLDEKVKIIGHLRDKHGYGLPKVPVPPITFKSTPLKIKEQHFRPVASVPSTSSGTDGDGEDTYAEDMMNNNNNYAKNLSLPKRMPKLFYKDDINHVQNAAIPENNRNRNNANIPRRIIPSIEELKKQLVNSDIDISEINMKSIIKEEEEGEIDEDEVEEEVEYSEEYPDGYIEDTGEDPDEENSEDVEEGASTSNQSFYENDIGEHFLFKADGDSESNYEDDGMMTPNFGMVDELYRRVDMASSAASSSEPSTSIRRRTFHNPCKLCKKVFPSLSMLKKHAKTHSNMHICKFCFDYFPSASGLSKHLRVHEDVNPNVCTVCQKPFSSWATLRTHMKIHSGERPFGCDQCGQRFQTKSTLDSHLRIHSGSRPHVCGICHKSFRTSSPLYRHMRSVHKGLAMTMGGAVTVNS